MKWSILLAVALALVACQRVPTQPQAPRAAPLPPGAVQFPGAGLTLAGELFLPTAQEPEQERHPAVVLLHGCGGMYTLPGRLTGRHRDWAQRFADWGFVVLLVDSLGPRGLGSLCELKDRPIHPWKERNLDAYAALDYLVTRSDVDRNKVFVVGWSHGGSTVTGVVRADAPGRREGGPQFTAAIAYYPSCQRPLQTRSYRPTMALLIQHGEADDWAPAAPCVELAKKMQQMGLPVQTILYAEAHHGFDAPSNAVRFFPNVYNPGSPGERGAHIGTHAPSRMQAIADTKQFLDQYLTR